MNKTTYFLIPLLLSLLLTAGGASAEAPVSSIERKHHQPWEPDVGYTQAVRVGNTLYLSGVTSDGSSFADQLDNVYKTIKTILLEFDVTTDSIVKETIFTTDIEALKEAGEVRKQHFKYKRYPASTWVQIDRLFMPEFLVEVEVIVEIPETK